MMEAAATAIEAATTPAVARVILWDALLDSGTEKICIICLDNTVDTIMQALFISRKPIFTFCYIFYATLAYIRHFFAGCYDNDPWYLVINLEGQFRDQKSLDFHEKSLDLSNYEIFPHKIIKSRTFKKSSILIVITVFLVKPRYFTQKLVPASTARSEKHSTL